MPLRLSLDTYLSAIAALLLTSPAIPAQVQRLTPELVIGLQSVEEVAISPDGEYLIYRIDAWQDRDSGPVRKVAQLWLRPVESSDTRRFAEWSFDARSPRWSPDGSAIAWLASHDPDAHSQVFVTQLTGGGKQLTNAPAGVSTFRWSPDGTRIAYTSMDPANREELRDRRGGKDWIVAGQSAKQRRLYIIDIRSGDTSLVAKQDFTVHDFAWSPDGDSIAIAAAPGPDDDDRTLRTQPYIVPAEGGEALRLTETAGKLTHLVWSSDGRWVGWLGSTSITDPAAGSVFVIPADRSAEARNLTEGFSGTATWLGSLPGKSPTFAFVAEERQATVLRAANADNGALSTISAPAQVFSGGPSFGGDGRRFAIVASAPDHPNELFVGDAANPRELDRLTSSNPDLDRIDLGKQEIFRWRSRDGTPIEGVLLKPPGFLPDLRYPVVLHVHGGSESVDSNGWQASFRNFGQVLAARGFVVLYPNYRGSRGRGVEFVRGNRRDMMGRSWEDIESGLDALVDAGIADGDRAGIYGFSWGGYAAAWGATYASNRFRAAVAGAGIYNWISEAGSNSTRMHEQLAHWDAPLYENFVFYLQRSPIFHIRRANTPILLLHGEEDKSCPLGQAIEFHTALEWKGVSSKLVIYPREGHGMIEFEHQLDFLSRGVRWFDRLR